MDLPHSGIDVFCLGSALKYNLEFSCVGVFSFQKLSTHSIWRFSNFLGHARSPTSTKGPKATGAIFASTGTSSTVQLDGRAYFFVKFFFLGFLKVKQSFFIF